MASLTTAQKAVFKADVEADAPLNAMPHDAQSAGIIAAAYQVIVTPAWIVWKTDVVVDEIMRNGMDWTQVDNLSVGKARIWDWLSKLGSFDASKPNIRGGIDACWVGSAPALAVRAAIYIHCKRSANRLEKLLSTGTGLDAVPATMAVNGEGSLSTNEVGAAMGWSF